MYYVGTDEPSLKELRVYVVQGAAPKWRDLGEQLLPPKAVLDIIEAGSPRDTVSNCERVLDRWLMTAEDATWNQLIRALRSPNVELNYLADRLKKMIIITECEKYNKYILAVTSSVYVTGSENNQLPHTQQQDTLFTIKRWLYTLINNSAR